MSGSLKTLLITRNVYRIEDLLKGQYVEGVRRNGDFVSTAMVESVLSKHPDIDDAYVYGVQTSATTAGEKELVAAIVFSDLNEDQTQSEQLTLLASWCARRLQKNEIPSIWQVLGAIPKTVSQKPIERACIAQLVKAGLADLPK